MNHIASRFSPENAPAEDVRPTLLFVDDEERILRSLRMLFAANYRVLMTTDGHEALALLKQERVHVLVSDQRMPKMSGVELLRQARDVSPGTMRLLLTGYSDLEAIIGSINDGEVFRYINKPWNADEIRKTVGEAADIALSLEKAVVATEKPVAAGEIVDILLIDHEPEVATAVRALLEDCFHGAYRLDWATNLREAMDILQRGKVSVIISEIRVGEEDATPFLKAIKRFHPEVVTIVLTSFSDTSLLMELINQGQIHRFLPKPMRKTMTARGIVSGIERNRQIRQRPELKRRHQVEVPRTEFNPNFISQIRGLFQRFATR